jgi:lipase ATG15
MLPQALTSLLVPLLGWFSDHYTSNTTSPHRPSTGTSSSPTTSSGSSPSLNFQLRHLHAVSNEARVLFHDVPQEETSFWRTNHESDGVGERPSSYSVATRHIERYRPSSFEAYTAARDIIRSRRLLSTTSSVSEGEVEALGWELEDVIAPDVEKREVLLLLAKMANDAYVVDEKDPLWYALDKGWNTVRYLPLRLSGRLEGDHIAPSTVVSIRLGTRPGRLPRTCLRERR